MNFLQIVPHYVPAYSFGGPLRVAYNLSCALVRAGHTVTVCTTNLQSKTEVLDVPLDHPMEIDGTTVYYEDVVLLRHWGFSPGLYQRVNKEMANADIVLVHAHYQFANWAGAYIARKHKKPYVIFAHSSLHYQAIRHKNRWLKRLYLLLLEHQNLRLAKFIVFNAEEEREQSLFSKQGQIIPSGVDEKEFYATPDDDLFYMHYPSLREKTIFLFLGRLDIQQKGLDLLIPAFAQAIAQNPQIHLVLAGPSEQQSISKLHDLVSTYKLSENITFTGLVVGDLKKSALQAADVFVLPSRFEGLSIALLEALHIGLPVLVTDRVGLHRTIHQLQAGIVVSLDVQSIANALLTLSHPLVRSSMRERATSLVREQYSWDAIANILLNKIKQEV